MQLLALPPHRRAMDVCSAERRLGQREGVGYVQGDKTLTNWHCGTCGIATHWTAIDPTYARVGVNLRLFDPVLWTTLPRRFVDGASW